MSKSCWFMRDGNRKWVFCGVAFGLASAAAFAQTVVFSDSFDDGDPGGVVSSTNWPYTGTASLPGRILNYRLHKLEGSDPGHQKNHTPSTDGQMGDPSIGGTAFEVDNNPNPYAAYHEFDPQTGILRLSAWVWDDVESRRDQSGWPTFMRPPIRGMVGLTAAPGPVLPESPASTEVYPYDDFAFIGVEARVDARIPPKPNPNDPGFDPYAPAHVTEYCYQWRTKTDGWKLTNNPVTGKPVPRREDFRVPSQIPQTWRHVEIVVRPYSGQVGDLQFFSDGQLVGQGRRAPGTNCQGVEFRRIQLGTRFIELPDAQLYTPPYSYEHFWFDDVELTVEPPGRLPCVNPQLRFDADGDGDVDQDDFAVFQRCITGADDPDGTYDCQACRCANSDGDLDIDPDDFGAFRACALGPEIPADVACDDLLAPP